MEKTLHSGVHGIISYIGIGSNLNNPQARCLEAIGYLQNMGRCTVLRQSSFYKTEPMGMKDQDWFVNAVVGLRTSLSVTELFSEMQNIERSMGREKTVPWGPRCVDLDLLLYGQDIVQLDGLIVPHREMHKRRFVIEPLCEIAPYVIHPTFGISIAGLMERLTDGDIVLPIAERDG